MSLVVLFLCCTWGLGLPGFLMTWKQILTFSSTPLFLLFNFAADEWNLLSVLQRKAEKFLFSHKVLSHPHAFRLSCCLWWCVSTLCSHLPFRMHCAPFLVIPCALMFEVCCSGEQWVLLTHLVSCRIPQCAAFPPCCIWQTGFVLPEDVGGNFSPGRGLWCLCSNSDAAAKESLHSFNTGTPWVLCQLGGVTDVILSLLSGWAHQCVPFHSCGCGVTGNSGCVSGGFSVVPGSLWAGGGCWLWEGWCSVCSLSAPRAAALALPQPHHILSASSVFKSAASKTPKDFKATLFSAVTDILIHY